MIEREVSFDSGAVRLAGTLALPADQGQFPAVVLIPGSGEVDRNENHRKLPINFFREVAWRLGAQGLMTLRYDKRGVGASEGDFWETGFFDNVADASAAIAYVKYHERTRPDAVYLLGHSEGALIATRLAGQGAEVAGVILIAGSARPGEDLLKWQAQKVAQGLGGFNGWLIRTLHIDVLKAQRKQLERIKNSTKNSLRIQILAKVNAKWMREFMAYDPSEDLSRIRVSVLAITGAKDIQTDPADLKRMADLVRSDFEYHELSDLTHILRREEGPPTLSTYKKQVKRPTDPRVLDLVSDWLRRKTVSPA